MSNHRASLMQNKRVMMVVLILLVVTVSYRMKDLLPERTPVAIADIVDMELHSPTDLDHVHRRALGYADISMAGIPDRGRDGALRLIPESRDDPFRIETLGRPSAKEGRPPESHELGQETVAPLACSTIHLWGLRSQAIISGRTMSVGDTIRGYQVKHIDEQGVLLNGDTEILFLPLRRKPDRQSEVWIAFDKS